jgi:ATP-dependent helicase HrpB
MQPIMSRDLPILELREKLLDVVRKQNRFILTAPTGSGKSTQVPQFLLNHQPSIINHSQIVILQPRRLAARLLAAWVARQRGVKLGEEVGYQIRFDDVTSPATRIRYVTEGVLLRQMLQDHTLQSVSMILFDEFHERHLYGDITLARVLQIQQSARPDLILGVMSATLDIGPLQKYLAPCETLSSAGRTFPVTVEHIAKPVGDMPIWDVAAEELERLVHQHPEGDALVFMPGAYEISRTVQAVRDALGSKFVVFPLHGDLPPTDQDAAVARYDQRKVVVATNVAETSITIDGVRLVVDSGLARIPRYDPYRGINTLLVENISRASADQRAGRAGRTAPGYCLRLWTEREHQARPAQELPEVKRLDLAEVVLTLRASGIGDVRKFRWLEPPDPKALERAEDLLSDLGALSHPINHEPSTITPLGRRMLAFPLHPRYSRMLLAAQEYGCVRPVALIAALTQGRELLVRRQGRQVEDARDDLFGGETESDFFVLMRAWRYAERNGFNVERCRRLGIHAQTARQVWPLFEQFLRIAEREGRDVGTGSVGATSLSRPATEDRGKDAAPTNAPTNPNEAIQKCILLGFSDHVARRLDAGTLRCELVHGRRGVLARESVVQNSPLLVAAEVREVQSGTGKDRQLNVILNLATAVKEEWLREMFPEDFNEVREVVFDWATRRVVVREQRRFRDLVLEEVVAALDERGPRSATAATADRSGAARLLAQQVVAGNLVLKNWDESVEQWVIRVNRLREWMPELELPAIGDAERLAMLEEICHGATGYKEIKDRPVGPVVKGWLTKQQQELVEQYAPERVELKSGRRVKLTYSSEGAPTISVRIQDLYGTNRVAIAGGRVAVRIQVLAPNNRPVQVTDNLAGFWRETYPKLKAELQRKYPKHQWR